MSYLVEATTRKRKVGSKEEDDAAPSTPLTSSIQILESDPAWQGISFTKDRGHIVALNSQWQLDVDRWEAMPSVSSLPDLQRIELYDCRYITSLHASVTDLQQLRVLRLIGCSALKSLPPLMDQWTQLEEVSKRRNVTDSTVSL